MTPEHPDISPKPMSKWGSTEIATYQRRKSDMKMKTYILIDRSGSMASSWDEMTGAVAEFAKGIKKKLFVAVFDSHGKSSFEEIHNAKASEWDAEKAMNAHRPRGMTPLYDAIGSMRSQVEKDSPEKAQIIIVTDGHENNSRELNAGDAKDIIKAWEKADFDVVWMGASFEGATSQATSLGLSAAKAVNMSDASKYYGTMSAIASRNAMYASGEVSASSDLGKRARKAAK